MRADTAAPSVTTFVEQKGVPANSAAPVSAGIRQGPIDFTASAEGLAVSTLCLYVLSVIKNV